MDGTTGSPGRHLELYAGVAAAHRAERAGDLVEPAYHEPAFPVIRRELRADNTRADWRAGLSAPGADSGRDPGWCAADRHYGPGRPVPVLRAGTRIVGVRHRQVALLLAQYYTPELALRPVEGVRVFPAGGGVGQAVAGRDPDLAVVSNRRSRARVDTQHSHWE